MKLTPKQIDFVNKEVAINNYLLAAEQPRAGLLSLIARGEALRLIVQLANIRD